MFSDGIFSIGITLSRKRRLILIYRAILLASVVAPIATLALTPTSTPTLKLAPEVFRAEASISALASADQPPVSPSASPAVTTEMNKNRLPEESQTEATDRNSQVGTAKVSDKTGAINTSKSAARAVSTETSPTENNRQSQAIEKAATPIQMTPTADQGVPQAQSVDLSEPVERVSEVELSTPTSSQPTNQPTLSAVELAQPKAEFSPAELSGAELSTAELSAAEQPPTLNEKQRGGKNPNQPLIILGSEVLPGASTRLSWKPDQSFEGIAAPTPVLVVNGLQAGPTLCLTAAIHGDELNGIEIVRRVLYEAKPEKLSGTLIGVPIVNLHGFHRTSRYLPDRRDLNRYFPGNPEGSSASRIAYSFFNEVVRHCDALVDLHTGSFRRTNLPQVRADLTNAAIVDLSQSFGATVVLHNSGTEGTLRRAAADAGIPAITLEAGEPMRLQQAAVNHGVKGIETLLNKMAMYKRISFWGDPEPVFYRSKWIRADQGGILFSEVELGESVRIGELLGTVTDPITNVRAEIQSPFKGRVLGRALDQVVMPGFAAFRIGIETSEQDMQEQSTEQSTEQKDILEDGQDESEIEAAKIIKKARAIDAIQNAEQRDGAELSE